MTGSHKETNLLPPSDMLRDYGYVESFYGYVTGTKNTKIKIFKLKNIFFMSLEYLKSYNYCKNFTVINKNTKDKNINKYVLIYLDCG